MTDERFETGVPELSFAGTSLVVVAENLLLLRYAASTPSRVGKASASQASRHARRDC